jgi:dUTP pyrophosphatase
MDKEELEDYLKKLQEFEEDLSGDGDLDENFINELNKVLNTLNVDIKSEEIQQPSSENYVGIKVKKLHENAVIPTYSKIGDAGMDLTITSIKENTSFSVTYGFGLAIELPKWYVGLVFPRSSVRNQELILSNCVGVIDSGYRGELQATFKKTNGLDSLQYKVGDRGAQLMVIPYPNMVMIQTDELSDTERGTGGFGSTGV